MRLAEQSRSTQAAARPFNIDPKRFYQWQKAAQAPVAAALGAALDPTTAAKLRAANRRQAQAQDTLKKAIARAYFMRRLSQKPNP